LEPKYGKKRKKPINLRRNEKKKESNPKRKGSKSGLTEYIKKAARHEKEICELNRHCFPWRKKNYLLQRKPRATLSERAGRDPILLRRR